WVIMGGVLIAKFNAAFLFRTIHIAHTPTLDKLIPFVTLLGEAFIVAPVLLLIFCFPKWRNRNCFSGALIASAATSILTHTFKHIFACPRPPAVFGKEPWFHLEPTWDILYHYSFPSGHSSSAFSFFVILALILNRRWQFFGALFFLLALGVACSRIYLGAHFFADVYWGSIIGTTVSVVVCLLCNRKKLKNQDPTYTNPEL